MGPLLHTRQHAWGRGAGQTQASGKVTRCRNQVTRRRAREKEDENKGAIVAGNPPQAGVRASQGGVERRALLSQRRKRHLQRAWLGAGAPRKNRVHQEQRRATGVTDTQTPYRDKARSHGWALAGVAGAFSGTEINQSLGGRQRGARRNCDTRRPGPNATQLATAPLAATTRCKVNLT